MYFHCVCLFHSTQFFAASIILRYFSFTSSGLLIFTLPSNQKSQPKNISFEFHLKNRHEKTQKPLWFLGFQLRYLFRCYLLVAGEGLDSRAAALGRASFWTSTGRPFIATPFQVPPIFAETQKQASISETCFSLVAGEGLEPTTSGL